MNIKNISTTMVGLCSLMAIAFQPAQAVLVSAGFPDESNDCAGYFGNSFGACTIFIGSNGDRIELSPVIAKLDVEGNEWELNSLYPTVTSDQFTVDGPTPGTAVTDADASGSWAYTIDDPVPAGGTFDPNLHDPGIRYWVAKSGNTGFTLWWDVDDASASGCTDGTGLVSTDGNYNLTCLEAANIMYENTWETQGQAISHITFYDTAIGGGGGTGGSTGQVEIPEPSLLGLMGIGLLGLGASSLRRIRRETTA